MNRYQLGDTIFPGDKVEIVRYHFSRIKNDMHCHDYAEISLIEEGEGIHDVNGKRIAIKKGDLLFIRPDDLHRYQKKDKDGFILLNIAVPFSTYQFILERYGNEVWNIWGRDRDLPFQIGLNTDEHNKYVMNMDKLSLHKSKQVEVDRFLLELIGMLGHYSGTDTDRVPSWLLKACEHIRSPVYFQEGIEAFYRLCEKSPGHISRVVMDLWRKTPTDIVNQARLEYAAMKLALSSVNILDISIDCGYSSLAYFYKVFNKHYGMTPRQYRLNRHSLIINYG